MNSRKLTQIYTFEAQDPATKSATQSNNLKNVKLGMDEYTLAIKGIAPHPNKHTETYANIMVIVNCDIKKHNQSLLPTAYYFTLSR